MISISRLEVLQAQLDPNICTTLRSDDQLEPEACKSVVIVASGDRLKEKVQQILLYGDAATRREAEQIFADSLFKPQFGLTMSEERALVNKRVKFVADRKFLDMKSWLDEKGTGFVRWSILNETMVYVDFSMSVKAGVHFGLFGGSILFLGSQEQQDTYLPKVQSLELPGCFALTELTHGSNARGVETTATFDSKTDEFVVHTPTDTAQKFWIGGAAETARMATVFAQLRIGTEDYGLHAFLVPLRDEQCRVLPGVRIKDCGVKMGLNGVDNGRIWFDHVRIPRKNLLSAISQVQRDGSYVTSIRHAGERFNHTIEALVGGRLTVGTNAVALSKAGLLIAIRYALTRRQFGKPHQPEVLLMDYTAHQRRLLPLLASTYALQIGVNYVRERFRTRTPKDRRDVFLLAAGFKAACTYHKTVTLQNCREACGGFGFAAESRIGGYKTDSDVDLTYEGDNVILLQAMAKALLDEFLGRLGTGGKKITSLLNYLGEQMSVVLRNKNPLTKRLTSEKHLLDLDMYEDAFVYREFKLLRLLATQFRLEKRKLNDTLQAWNQCQPLALALGKAYIDRVVVEQFTDALSKCDSEVRPLLKPLLQLHALSKIEADVGWFMTQGYFAPSKAAAIHDEIATLCKLIRPNVEFFVAALGVPEHLVAAPIAGDWKKYYAYNSTTAKL